MSFKPYIANQKFHTLKPEKMQTNEKIELISPIAQGLSQAQLEIKRKYDELVKTNPEFDIKPSNKRKKSQSSISKRGRKN